MRKNASHSSPLVTIPLEARIISQLKELVDVPFTLRAFRERWTTFGWSHEPHADDRFGFRVAIDSMRSLQIGPLQADVLCAFHAFTWWEDYDPGHHSDPSEYARHRAAYDSAFDAAVDLARSVLPPPMAEWTDTDPTAHRAVVWRGTHGLLVLQQGALDIQFGYDLDFWLAPVSPEQYRPSTPFCEWIYRVTDRMPRTGGVRELVW